MKYTLTYRNKDQIVKKHFEQIQEAIDYIEVTENDPYFYDHELLDLRITTIVKKRIKSLLKALKDKNG